MKSKFVDDSQRRQTLARRRNPRRRGGHSGAFGSRGDSQGLGPLTGFAYSSRRTSVGSPKRLSEVRLTAEPKGERQVGQRCAWTTAQFHVCSGQSPLQHVLMRRNSDGRLEA